MWLSTPRIPPTSRVEYADEHELVRRTRAVQELVNDGALSYNGAFDELYRENPAWQAMSARQTSDFAELEEQQAANEKAAHRAVGLVLETRPEAATPENLKLMRFYLYRS